MTDRVNYYAPKGKRWELKNGADAARAVREGPQRPTSDKAPPPLRNPPPRQQAPDGRKIERLDLQEIPGAMDKMGWRVAAKLMREWFAGAPNEPSDARGKKDGIAIDKATGQHHPYPPDMIDTTTIKMDWVLSYPRARVKYDELTTSAMSPESLKRKPPDAPRSAFDLLREIALRHAHRAVVRPVQECGGDMQQLHRQFQFQRALVDTTSLEKARVLGRALKDGVPDDLDGALGGFAFYAAVGEMEIELIGDVAPFMRQAVVTKVVIYVKNPYSFFDSGKEGSQYLGHWNKKGMVAHAEGYLAQKVNIDNPDEALAALGGDDFPIVPPNKQEDAYYPVHNKDFRDWRDRHKQGGDMILYSDVTIVALKNPIVIQLGRASS